MTKYRLIQRQYNALRDTVIDTTVIGEFRSRKLALDFLGKRGYRFDSVEGAWIHGNTLQFPVTIQEVEQSLFDIRSFV
jgi:hypothetical protein